VTSASSLPDIPHPPEKLLDAADAGKLVLFVGAGVSRLCGSPGWEDFSHALLAWLIQKGLINHSIKTQLAELPLKMRLSISLSIAEKKDALPSDNDYRAMLMTRNEQKRSVGNSLYRDLTSIGRYYVTTNYDEWLQYKYSDVNLDKSTSNGPIAVRREIVCRRDELTIPNMEQGKVIHLHGSLDVPKTMVITTSHYLLHYKNDQGKGQNPVTAFLLHLFQKGDWTVLFLGYGMEEMDVLEYVLQKSHVYDEEQRPTPRHYLLRGFYSHQKDLLDHLATYYEEHCGVRLVPFSLDGGDHPQLCNVISDWAKRIRVKPLPPLEKRLEYQKLLNS
jgi:hypothetical protein